MADNDWETADLGPKPTQVRAKKAPVLLARPPAAPATAPTGAEFAPQTINSSFPPAGAPSMGGDSGPKLLLNPASANSPSSESPVPGDEDWFRGSKNTNRQIWDTANRAGPSIVPTSAAAPPPKMQILKRPNASAKPASNSSNSGTSTPSKSIEQREEEYRLARERIFGPSSEQSPTGSATASTGPGTGAGGDGSGSGNGTGSAGQAVSTSASTWAPNTGPNHAGGSSGPSPVAPSPMYPGGAGGGYAPAGRRSGPSSRSTSGRGTPRTDDGAVLARAVDRLSIGPGGQQSTRRSGSNTGANPGGGYVPAQYYTYGYQSQPQQQPQQQFNTYAGQGYQQSSYPSQQAYNTYPAAQGQGQGQYSQYGGGQAYSSNNNNSNYGNPSQQQQQQSQQGFGRSQGGYSAPAAGNKQHSQYYAGYGYAPGAPGAPSGERSSATPPSHGRHSQPHSHHNTPPHPGSHSHSHSSSTSISSHSSSPAPALRGGMSPGVLRQPRGPGSGGGFGAVGSGSAR